MFQLTPPSSVALLAGANGLEFTRGEGHHGAGGSIETVGRLTDAGHRPVHEQGLVDGGQPGQTASLAPVLTRGGGQAEDIQHGARPAPPDLVVRGVAQAPPVEEPAETYCRLLPS